MATLKPLGSGYAVLDLGREQKVIQSLPLELSADGTRLMALGEGGGFVSPREGCGKLGWSMDRVERALVRRMIPWGLGQLRTCSLQSLQEGLLRDGLAWVDEQGGADQSMTVYWFPCYFKELANE